MDIKPQFEKTKQILQGLELIYPDYLVIGSLLRLLKGVTYQDDKTSNSYIVDLINVLGAISSNPLSFSLQELKAIIYEKDPVASTRVLLNRASEEYPNVQAITDLKKMYSQFVNHGHDVHAFRFLHKMTGLRLINNIAAIKNKVTLVDLHECFSKGQVNSKLWLVEELNRLSLPYSNIQIHCGWYALHAHLLHKPGLKIQSFDLNPASARVSLILNQDSPNHSDTFSSQTKDVYEIREYKDQTLVINTSCEHLEHFDKWYQNIPRGSRLAIQSNDFFECDQHTNCVANLEEFNKMAPMTETLFAGELPLPKYTRFMLIGVK